MKQRILSLLIAGAMILTLTACNDNDTNDNTGNENTTETTNTTDDTNTTVDVVTTNAPEENTATSTDESTSENGNGYTVDNERPEVQAFVTPLVFLDTFNIQLNLTAEDPSDFNNFYFEFDESGRVSEFHYRTSNHDMALSYLYQEDGIQIYGFIGEIVVADEFFKPLTEFDPSGDFVESRGYFFKGFTFE
jgi:hypothetical protein